MVGEILRNARERQKLTIKDVEHGTSIRAIYIEAIENGEYDKLPGEVYTKGFIKNYGNFLMLDGEGLLRQFVNEISSNPVVDDDIPDEEVVAAPVENTRTNNLKITELENPNLKIRKKNSGSNSNAIIAAAVIIVALISGGLWYSTKNSDGENSNPTVQVVKNEEKNISDVDKIPQEPTPAVPAGASPAPVFEGVNLQANFTDQCWTRVTVDGVVVYEGMIAGGQSHSWQGKEKISIRVGNAGAVEFVQNGQTLGVMGAGGEVLERTFTNK